MAKFEESNKDLPTVKTRLLYLLKYKRMSQTEFARLLGVSPTFLGAMRKSMRQERIQKVLQIFPDVNRDWLVYGEGEMITDKSKKSLDISKGYIVPLLPVNAFGGNLQLWSKGVQLADCEKIVSPVPGVDFAIRISGNSMEPEFPNGSLVFIKKINDKAFIPWGNPMVIDTENGVLIKTIYPTDENATDSDYVEARSYNPAYPPIRIPTDSIYSIYRIILGVKQYTTL